MGRITGRPKKAIRQEKNIGFFVTNAQWLVIQKKVKEAGVNISDYMRQVAVFGQVVTRWKEDERELFKKMVGISNDVNQLVHIARQEGALHAVLHFERYRGIIDDVIKRLGKDPRRRMPPGEKGAEGGMQGNGEGPAGRTGKEPERRSGKTGTQRNGEGPEQDGAGKPINENPGHDQ